SYHLAREGYGDVAFAPSLLTAVLAGACLGFLPHNFSPARIFMGDSGSMLIGLTLAASAVTASSTADSQTFANSPADTLPMYLPFLLPLVVLAIPLVDLVMAVVRRVKAGRSPFSPDKLHLHHRLLEIGHSHSRAVLIMYFWSALIAFGAVAFSVQSSSLAIVLLIVLLCAVGLVVLLLPRFTPRIPGWAEALVPPRYRSGQEELPEPLLQGDPVQLAADAGESGEAAEAMESEQHLDPAFAGLHGATAISTNRQQGAHSSRPACDGQHTK
ncbi:MAG: MraY family glycosyltransferase, partial [Streptomyces sp.]|uniref:MraY family glycosyltransferase n=1 Tax=Streptomyces sp. TaxID=1931 RepID=UPI003D6B282A